MTSCLAAVLVDKGLLSWELTVAEGLASHGDGFLSSVAKAYHSVTLLQLLSCTGGVRGTNSSSIPSEAWNLAWQLEGNYGLSMVLKMEPREQRKRYLGAVLKLDPRFEAG